MTCARIFAILVLTCGLSSPPSSAMADVAAPEKLAALVHDHLQRMELPPMHAEVRYVLLIGPERLELDAAGLESIMSVQRRLISSYHIEQFRMDAADCGPDLCWIRYGYRFQAKVGASTSSGEVNNQELWMRDEDGFVLTLGISRQ